MPGVGRGPPGRGPAGRGGIPGGGLAGRGMLAGLTPNGLLPGRGPGRAAGRAGIPGESRSGAEGASGDARGAVSAAGALAAGAVSATGGAGAGVGVATLGTAAGVASASGGGLTRWAGEAAALAAAFFVGRAAFFAPSASTGCGGKASLSLRATGASTVDDADFTNSPSSLSLVMTSLLGTPSSFASSCTRALPATGLLIRSRAAGPLQLLPTCDDYSST